MLNIPGREVHWFESVDSTMRVAGNLVFGGCAAGTVVVAGEQTAGQGRLGRSWQSERGTGLYASIVLRPSLEPDVLPLITLALGLAAAAAIEACVNVACDLRWPNDVLIHGRKCAGILVQMVEQAIIAGIGINANQTEFPGEIADTATSLRMESGKTIDLQSLLTATLDAVDSYMEILASRGRAAILDLFSQKSSYVSGRSVTVEEAGRIIRGVTDGLTESGFLRLLQSDGAARIIYAGGVRPCS